MHPAPSDAMILAGSYDYRLVALSVVISCVAAYAALDLGSRVTSARGAARGLWLSGGATAMGTGIWSMHYIGMLAFHLPVPVMYDWPTVLLSLLAAIAASGIALFVVSLASFSLLSAIVGSVFMGAGIATMHYTGMAAMRLPAMHHYSMPIVALSVALAIGISFVALFLTFRLRGDVAPWGWQKITASVIMGAAIPVMHYTGMAAASFTPAPLAAEGLRHAVSVSTLGITGIVAATLMILALVLVSSMADREFSAQVRERRQAETALVDSQQTYDVTFDAAPIGIAHVSSEGEWIRVNQHLVHLLGYTIEELKSRPVFALMHPDDTKQRDRTRELLAEANLSRQVFQTRYLRGDGKYIWASVTIRANRKAANREAPFVMIVEDITERRALEERFRQGQKMEAIGQLAAGVAHDFSNILTVIIGFNELAMERLDPKHPGRTDLQHALVAAQSAQALTRQLLAFSRKQVLRPQLLDLNVVINRMEMLLRRTTGERLEFDFQLAPSVGAVKADRFQIEQVVMNLVVNARDAMPKGGSIKVSTCNVNIDETYALKHEGASAGFYVRIAVSDTGNGIPEQIKPRLFEPFFTTKERGKGTGLGLATVYGIVKQSGGFIAVDSEIGQGATFSVHLPRAGDLPVPEPDPPEVAQLVGGTETILLAEDEPDVAAIIVETLSRHGYSVLETRGAEEAVRIAGNYTNPIHLLLTDVVMPDTNGHDLAHKVLERLPKLRVLYTSGYSDHPIVQHDVIGRGHPFIQKPFSSDELLRKVRQVLDATQPV
jgi:PAS domain S-box-containing protein